MSLENANYVNFPRDLLNSDDQCTLCLATKEDDGGIPWVAHPNPNPEKTDELIHAIHRDCAREMLKQFKECSYRDVKELTLETTLIEKSSERIGYVAEKVVSASIVIAGTIAAEELATLATGIPGLSGPIALTVGMFSCYMTNLHATPKDLFKTAQGVSFTSVVFDKVGGIAIKAVLPNIKKVFGSMKDYFDTPDPQLLENHREAKSVGILVGCASGIIAKKVGGYVGNYVTDSLLSIGRRYDG